MFTTAEGGEKKVPLHTCCAIHAQNGTGGQPALLLSHLASVSPGCHAPIMGWLLLGHASWLLLLKSVGGQAPVFCRVFSVKLIQTKFNGMPDPLLVVTKHKTVSCGGTVGCTAGAVFQQFESPFSFMFLLLCALWSFILVLIILCLSSVG